MTFVLSLCALLAADAEVAPNTSQELAPEMTPAMTEAAPPKPAPAQQAPRNKSRRTEREFEVIDRSQAPHAIPTTLELLRPGVLEARNPGGALAMGLVLGFGSGYYYAGETKPGILFSVIDSLAVGGLFGATFALNQLVVQNDIRTGKSLKHDGRELGEREEALYITSWVLVGVEIASRVVQGVGSYRAANRTNAVLDEYSVIPLK